MTRTIVGACDPGAVWIRVRAERVERSIGADDAVFGVHSISTLQSSMVLSAKVSRGA